MKQVSRHGGALAVAAAILVSPVAMAQDFAGEFEPIGNLNLIGLGIAGVPDFYGSDKNTGAAVPLLRYKFEGTERYVQVLGPELKLNLLDRKDWRVGPVLRVRARRDEDVDNEVVKRMRHIPSATELGVFGSYNLFLDGNPSSMHKVVFSADVVGNTTDVYTGATGNLRVDYFHPFPQNWSGKPMIGSVGFGMFFASGDFNTKYFGVTGSDVALYPTLLGREYRPESGLTSIKIPFSLTTQMAPQWLLTVGGRYEHLLNDAKDSPIVDLHGSPNQWSLGAVVSYAF